MNEAIINGKVVYSNGILSIVDTSKGFVPVLQDLAPGIHVAIKGTIDLNAVLIPEDTIEKVTIKENASLVGLTCRLGRSKDGDFIVYDSESGEFITPQMIHNTEWKRKPREGIGVFVYNDDMEIEFIELRKPDAIQI